MQTLSPRDLHRIGPELERACAAVARARREGPAAETKALQLRAELLEALATMARSAGPAAAAVKIAAQLAAEADAEAAAKAARRQRRVGNPVAGLLADQMRAR